METRVQVEHYRIPVGLSIPLRYYRGYGFKDAGLMGISPAGKGGATVVKAKIGRVEVIARADCSLKDQFCYRSGRAIAMTRLKSFLGDTALDGIALV